MDARLINWLIETGLDEQRAKLYLIALSKGPAKASDLARDSGISRTAVYDNLRYLEGRGYLQRYTHGKRTFYEALSPESLKERFSNHLVQLQELLPDFMQLKEALPLSSSIEIHKGKNSARAVFEDILKVAHREYCYISNPIETYKTLSRKYIEDWIDRRVKQKIRARALRTIRLKDPEDQIFANEDRYLRKIRYLPGKIQLLSTIYIYGKTIGLLSSYREERSMIIRSADLAATLQQLFEILWGIAERE